MLQDVNMATMDPVDHWLAMNMAANKQEFVQAFKDYDGMIFNNTMYADREGNASISMTLPCLDYPRRLWYC